SMNEQSMNEQSMNEQSMNEQSMNEQSMNEQSMNEQSMNEQSMNEQSMNEQSMNEQSMSEQSMSEQSMSEQSMSEQSSELERADTEAQAGTSQEEALPVLEEQLAQEEALAQEATEDSVVDETTAADEMSAEEAQALQVVAETDNDQSTEPVIESQLDGQPQSEPMASQDSWMGAQPAPLTPEQMPRQDAPAFFSRAKIIGLTVAAASVIGVMLWAFQTSEPEVRVPESSAVPAVSNEPAAEESKPESSVAPTLNGLKLSDRLDQQQ
ncbi:MAG: hypothetical protein Q8J80_09980, partial [Gallionella sp.]|nr:hypothetical protein [Gallionella sp.]